MNRSTTPTPPTTALPGLTRMNEFFKDSLWKCTFAARRAHGREGQTSAYPQEMAHHGLRGDKSHLGQSTVSPFSLCWLTWTSSRTHCQYIFLAGSSANKWPKAYVREQAQNNARGTAPADGSQPGIASRQLAGGCGHLLRLQLRGDPARLLGRKPPRAGSISPKFRCLQSAAEQVGQGPF